jgi:hypothetical protein
LYSRQDREVLTYITVLITGISNGKMLNVEQASAELVVAGVDKQPGTCKSPMGNAVTPIQNIEIKTKKEE